MLGFNPISAAGIGAIIATIYPSQSFYEPGQKYLPPPALTGMGCDDADYVIAVMSELKSLSQVFKAERIIIGDSAIAFARRDNFPNATFPRFYHLNYANLAVNSMTLHCALPWKEIWAAFEPTEIILTLGGNDLDVIEYHRNNETTAPFTLSETLANAATLADYLRGVATLHIVAVNYAGAYNRSATEVAQLNAVYETIAQQNSLIYVPPLASLGFASPAAAASSGLALGDGEHLTVYGINAWIAHIAKHIPNLIP